MTPSEQRRKEIAAILREEGSLGYANSKWLLDQLAATERERDEMKGAFRAAGQFPMGFVDGADNEDLCIGVHSLIAQINALKLQTQHQRSAIAEARAELDAARKVLEPFADWYKRGAPGPRDSFVLVGGPQMRDAIRWGHFRRAAEALAPRGAKTEERDAV